MRNEYLVIYEPPQEEPNWGAWVPELPGCVAAGDGQSECERMIAETIARHLRGMREDGDPIPPPAAQAGLVRVAA